MLLCSEAGDDTGAAGETVTLVDERYFLSK